MSNETAVTVWTPPGAPTSAELTDMRSAAIEISKADIVKPHFRGKPANVFVALVTGRDLGIPWTIALQKGFVVDGKFDLEVDVKVDLVRRNLPGFDFEVVRLDETTCTIKGGVKGRAQHEITYTYDQAVKAGFTKGLAGEKQNWREGRRGDMLLARCLARLLKRTGGLYASLLTSLDADAADVSDDAPAPVRREPSSAAVVDEPRQPDPPAAPEALATPIHVEAPSTIDWQYRLMCAVATLYGRKAMPPSKQPGRSKWAKANTDDLLRAVNHYYEAQGLQPVVSWSMFPPMDVENVTRWLEEKNKKRVGSVGQDAPVAQNAPPARDEEPDGEPVAEGANPGAGTPTEPQATAGDAALPAEEAPAPLALDQQTEILARGTVDDVLRELDALKFATKGARRFYDRHATSGNPYLVDSHMLRELGHVNNGAPVSQRIDNLWGSEADRIMLARLIVEVRTEVMS